MIRKSGNRFSEEIMPPVMANSMRRLAAQIECDCMKLTASATRSQWRRLSHPGEVICAVGSPAMPHAQARGSHRLRHANFRNRLWVVINPYNILSAFSDGGNAMARAARTRLPQPVFHEPIFAEDGSLPDPTGFSTSHGSD